VTLSPIVGIGGTAIAQNAGDPVTVQSGSYLSPTAEGGGVPFLLSYNCYSFTIPPFQGCDVESREYSAALFGSSVAAGQAIQINSFTFFSNSTSLGHASIIPNLYDVYMGIAGGPLSFFGTFGGGNPVCGELCSMTCNIEPSATCMPEGSGGIGSYVYDPELGNLQIKMVETRDMAVGNPMSYWYDDGALVTRFDGLVVATPEPSTIALVATGFAGMLGFAIRRRRPRWAVGRREPEA
jgi:hypothetical protein